MKTVIHNKKVYEITDNELHSLNHYQDQLNKLPKEQRKGSLEEQMFNDCKFEIFSRNEYKSISKIL